MYKTDEHGMRWTLDIDSTHWITQRTAAGLLNVTVMTINTWVRQGKIRSAKLRKGVSVISMQEIEQIAIARGSLPGENSGFQS